MYWGNPLEEFVAGSASCVAMVSGYQLGRQMVVANLMESLYLVPASTYRLCGGKAQQRNNGICQHFFPKRELP